jgi:hypothetical protein
MDFSNSKRRSDFMKKLLAAFVFLVSWPIISMAGPQLSLPEIHWDYGNVPQNAILTHGYWLKNTGDDTLRIFEVKPGCGCTSGTIQKKALAPDDSTVVELIFGTKTSKGRVSKNAKITCNDTSRASLTIDFAANIISDPDTISNIRFNPQQLTFSKDTTKCSVTVENLDSLQVNLVMAGLPLDGINAKVKNAAIKKGKTAKLEFEWKGTPPEYDTNHVLTFATGLPDKESARFSIPYTIRGTKGPKPGTTPQHAAPITAKGAQNIGKPNSTGQITPPEGQGKILKQVTPDSINVEKQLPSTKWPPK